MSSLAPEMQSAITRAAIEEGIDPAFALSVAERESSFNPTARSSKTIRGLFQMMGPLRSQYGVDDSNDPYTQTKGWARFIKDTKPQMAPILGRDPTDEELYTGHHFGATRAARMLRMDPNTPVDQVFTPNEIAQNPHFGRAGTVGALNSSILADMKGRHQKFGAAIPDLSGESEGAPDKPDFASFGTPLNTASGSEGTAAPPASPKPAARPGAGTNTAPGNALDLSSFGSPA